jgi:hypothetical protein
MLHKSQPCFVQLTRTRVCFVTGLGAVAGDLGQIVGEGVEGDFGYVCGEHVFVVVGEQVHHLEVGLDTGAVQVKKHYI